MEVEESERYEAWGHQAEPKLVEEQGGCPPAGPVRGRRGTWTVVADREQGCYTRDGAAALI